MIRRRNIADSAKDSFTATLYIASTIAAQKFFIAPVKCMVISMKEVHTTAGDHASAVTGAIERLQGTEALGSGDNLCTSEVNLKGTAETVQTATLTSTAATKTLAAGDRLGFKLTGNSQNLAGMLVTVLLRPID